MKKIFMFLMAATLFALPSCKDDETVTSSGDSVISYEPILTGVIDNSDDGVAGEFSDNYSTFSFFSNTKELKVKIKFTIDDGYKILSATPGKDDGTVYAAAVRSSDDFYGYYIETIDAEAGEVMLVKSSQIASDGVSVVSLSDQEIAVTFATLDEKPAGTFKFTVTTSAEYATPEVSSVYATDINHVASCSSVDPWSLKSSVALLYDTKDYEVTINFVMPRGVSLKNTVGDDTWSATVTPASDASNGVFTVKSCTSTEMVLSVEGDAEDKAATVAYTIYNGAGDSADYTLDLTLGSQPTAPIIAALSSDENVYAELDNSKAAEFYEYYLNYLNNATTADGVVLNIESGYEESSVLELGLNTPASEFFDISLDGYAITIKLKDDPTTTSNYNGELTITEYIDGAKNPFDLTVNLSSVTSEDIISSDLDTSVEFESNYGAYSKEISISGATITNVTSSNPDAFTATKVDDDTFSIGMLETTTSKDSATVRLTVTDGDDISRYDIEVSEAKAVQADVKSVTLVDEDAANKLGHFNEDQKCFDFNYNADFGSSVTFNVEIAEANKLDITGYSALDIEYEFEEGQTAQSFTVKLPADAKLVEAETLSIKATDADNNTYVWDLVVAQNAAAPTPDILSITGANEY